MSIRARWESLYPLVGGFGGAGAYLLFFDGLGAPKEFANLLTSVISVAGIASAFLMAIQALIMSMNDHYVVKQLKGLKLYRKMSRYLMEAIYLTLLLSAVSGAAFFVDWSVYHPRHTWLLAGWVFLVGWTVLSSLRIIRLFALVLDSD